MAKYKKLQVPLLLTFMLLLGGYLRFYHIEFGLPHSFYADEPELAEPAIKYTYEMINILTKGEYFKLVPVSFVYGTVPTYILTIFVMGFSKVMNLLNFGFDKTTLYIGMRSINALVSLALVPAVYFLALQVFKRKQIALVAALLTALNWKLIVHAHYVNADIFLTLFSTISLGFLSNYSTATTKKSLYASAIFYGLSIGTKVTSLITAPFIAGYLVYKKNYYTALIYFLIALVVFMATNPFAVGYRQDFFSRMYEMKIKEAGLVFDSSDTSPFKYISALAVMSTPFVAMASVAGILLTIKRSAKQKNFMTFENLLIALIGMYLIFYSSQSRRVDRWLLPVLPIIFMFAAQAFSNLKDQKPKFATTLCALIFGFYMVNPLLLLTQFARWTPKAAAYLWMQRNTDPLSTKLVYTEEGLDPMNKLPWSHVVQFNVYEAEGAFLFYPENPELYDYVVISSRPMQNFKRTLVKEKYPEYAARWEIFEKTLMGSGKFALIAEFTLPKPNLVPLSDVYIYQKLH